MQLTLWSLERMQELEEAHLAPEASPTLQRDFQWCAPWLCGSGLVMIRTWRGKWVLAEPSHPEAERYRRYLCRACAQAFGSELWAAKALLQEHWERDRMLADVMEEAVALLRAERIPT
jgi:hypothetical protein